MLRSPLTYISFLQIIKHIMTCHFTNEPCDGRVAISIAHFAVWEPLVYQICAYIAVPWALYEYY